MQYIDETRDILDTELTGLVGESYNRAYGVMVNIQLLSEMEEICRCLASPERKPQLKKIWWDRLLVSLNRFCAAVSGLYPGFGKWGGGGGGGGF